MGKIFKFTGYYIDPDGVYTTAAVVEVVRCKGCKYRSRNNENEPYCTAKDGLSEPWDDCFCSYGERKE